MSKYNHADHLLDKYYKVLDNGFVGLKDYFGSDPAIEAAARVSYQSGTRQVSDTRVLLRYLISHNHSSPLEQASITFHLRMPLYVIQQLLRHRTAKLNMESFRYSEVPDLCQKTEPNKWRVQSENNKQGSSGYLNENDGDALSDEENWVHTQSREAYQTRIVEGVAREQARKDIPVSTYASLYWTMDVRNLLHFMSLRCDAHAQEEIREYANVIAGFVKEVFPITFEAWYDYAFQAISLSRMDRELLQYMFIETEGNLENKAHTLGMTKRELSEFYQKIRPAKLQDFTLDKTLEFVPT